MKIFKLRDIAGWGGEDSEVSIPPLQRGLVWKPNQVEMLWDSILRGFPVGSFMLSDSSDGKYSLLDGQQRFNAISLGYFHDKNDTSVLWLDVDPKLPGSSTRKYLVKATTIPHPWGYDNGDDSSRLSTAEKREAIKEFGLNGTIYTTSFSLSDTWPIKASKPIPLYCFANANRESEDLFLQSVIDNFANSGFSNRNHVINSLTEENRQYIRTLHQVFKKLDKYEIVCNHLTKEVLENETDISAEADGESTALEILFTRLNTGGTTISRDDLLYSSIKAYWPEIKESIDRESKSYMDPARLVNLVFRLMLSVEGENLGNQPSLKKIRTIAKREPDTAKSIIEFCNNHLHSVLHQIDIWLNVGNEPDSTPTVLRTSIINRSEEIYLFLMYLANVQIRKGEIGIDGSYIKSLTLTLHFFANDAEKVVNSLYSKLSKEGTDKVLFNHTISESLYNEWLNPIFSPEEIRSKISIKTSHDWKPRADNPIAKFFQSIFYNREILLYAQKEYLNIHFPNYDPARKDMWEDYNRPWDYDHIIPQDWISNKRSEYREYCKYWLWCIGNLAAISFDANRSKSNRNNFSEYETNAHSLIFNRDIENLNKNITYSKEQSVKFAEITFNRLCLLYERLYRDTKCVYQIDGCFDDKVEKRKHFVESFISRNADFKIWFYHPGGEYFQLSAVNDWIYRWIAAGKLIGDFFIAVEVDCGGKCWLGIRRKPMVGINHDVRNSIQKLKGRFPDFDFSDNDNYYCHKIIDYQSFEELEQSNDLKEFENLARQVSELTE